ncbi:unnamed protein product [Caenorhabditis sp. 36 PRJEB53466]|nr:unnamed protein product [Caenorhabditis sp. 36 PRJEB53466]
MEIRPEYVFIGILILVPLQLWLSPAETGHLKYNLNSMIFAVKQHLPTWITGVDAEAEAEHALKIETEMDPNGGGAYGLGQYTRQRAPQVEFRVGDIVHHHKSQFRGVVVGWDETAIAPENFLRTAHGDNEHYATQPNYAILIDTRDRLTPQLTYAPQENLEPTKGTVLHPLVAKFFDGFDEKRQKYVMRPIYKQWYPDD